MRHAVYEQSDAYPVAILIKSSAFNEREIQVNYLEPLAYRGISQGDVIAVGLPYENAKKASNRFIKEQLADLLLRLTEVQTQTLYCADANYFKVLTGERKAEPHLGYIKPCVIPGYTHLSVTLGINHKSLIYNPLNESKLSLSLDTLANHTHGTSASLGQHIIHSATYPVGTAAIQDALNALFEHPALTVDIETFSLRFEQAGIATIAFAWSEHEGIAFSVDYNSYFAPTENNTYGKAIHNHEIRYLLKDFFERYNGQCIYHGSNFDIKVLIYQLWMQQHGDTKNLLKGLDILTRNFHDTRIIAYLAVNSTAGNDLSLKELAHPFAGNWAQSDIKDVRRIPEKDLLEYNLIDALSTFWVYKQYVPRMIADQQAKLYENLMLPSLKVIIQTELTGMPLCPVQVQKAKTELHAIRDSHLALLQASTVVRQTTQVLREDACKKKNDTLKVKQVTLADFAHVEFNPNSADQVRYLLYTVMQLPVLDYTASKQASTKSKTIKALLNHTDVPEHKQVLEALMGYNGASKILSTFIPAFEAAIDTGEPTTWLHGNFNLGGTVSGRLSSSGPNMQNIPSGSRYGKLIKSCFKPPADWLMAGADFNSLEDYISALTTRDPNKLALYLHGYDGHSLRAYSYFKDQLTDVRQAVETERCFKIKVGDEIYVGKTGDTVVVSSGPPVPIEEYYETHCRLRS